MAIAGYLGTIQGQTGVSTAFSQLPTTDISPATALRTQYRITDSTKRYWDQAVVPTVETSPNGSTGWVAATGYVVQYAGGVVVFAASQPNPTFVRVSGNSYPLAAFAGFTKWSADLETMLADVTTLGAAGGAKVFQPTLQSAKVAAEGYWVDSYFFTKLTTGAICVIGLFTGDGGHYDCYAYVSKLGLSDDVSALINEKRELQVTGQFYWYAT